jgi:hypothetical protein
MSVEFKVWCWQDITDTLTMSMWTWLKHWELAVEMLTLQRYCMQRDFQDCHPDDKVTTHALQQLLDTGYLNP